MHTSIRRYRVEPAEMDELMRRIDEGFARHIAVRPGFATYEAIDCGEELITVSAFLNAEEADASRSLARDWVRTALADLTLEVVEVLRGEVLVNRAPRDAMKPAHPESSREHADIRRLALRGGDIGDAVERVRQGLADELSALPGCLGFRAMDCEGEFVLFSLFADPEQASAADALLSDFSSAADGGVEFDQLEHLTGEVRASRTRNRMVQFAD